MTEQLNDLSDYLDSDDNGKVLEEVHRLTADMGITDFSVLDKVYEDIVRLFNGQFPGYRASNTKYHNLEHTNAVALAVVRLLHGLWSEGHVFTSRDILSGIVSALFHDTGLIQTDEDTEGTGAKYTIGHELRSIDLIRKYLPPAGFDMETVEDCANMVLYTMLSKPIQDIPFRGDEVSLMGRILGTADLLAQVADRKYLEKLTLLFFEFQEGKVPYFNTELDLLIMTETFYENIFKKRLYGDFGGIVSSLKSYFRIRFNIDYDPYTESVEKNIRYLRSLNENCSVDYKCYLSGLRRGNIIRDLYGMENP